jgi:hypothetical protein
MKINLKKNLGVTIIQGVLIILIAPLYIIYLSKYFNEKAESFLVAIAAITSTIFLYLSFREAKKANELKKSDLIISDFQNEINKTDVELSKIYFNISDDTRHPFILLKNISFKKFHNDLTKFIEQIIADTDFQQTQKLVSNCESFDVNDDTKFQHIKNLTEHLSKLNFFIANFVIKEMEYLRLLKAIDSSYIESVHKEILMKNADNIFSDLIAFHYVYNRKKELYDGIIQIRSLYLKNNTLTKVQPFSLNAFDDTVYFVIQELRVKYINEK